MEAVTRPLRADAERNRRRLLDAAAGAFAEGGLDVSVAEIARRAGVGQGTVFRHFPAKDDLVAAVIQDRFAEMIATARATLEQPTGEDTLVGFLRAMVERQVRDRGLFEAVAGTALTDPAVNACHGELLDLAGELLRRSQEAGHVRDDIGPIDLVVLGKALAAAAAPLHAVSPRSWHRYLDLVRDALRPAAAAPLSGRPPTRAQFERAIATLDCR